jgi:hypothetical protein
MAIYWKFLPFFMLCQKNLATLQYLPVYEYMYVCMYLCTSNQQRLHFVNRYWERLHHGHNIPSVQVDAYAGDIATKCWVAFDVSRDESLGRLKDWVRVARFF